MDQNDQTNQVNKTVSDDNQTDKTQIEAKPSRFLCLEDGQDSVIEGPCPICGKPMVPDNEEIPGEKAVDDDDAHDGMPEEKNEPEAAENNVTSNDKPEEVQDEPEKYSVEELKEAEQMKDEELIATEE